MEQKKFNYTYSVPTEKERREIEYIKNQYLKVNCKDDKYLRLKKLDNKVKQTPTAISLTLGIIGILIFGLGFSMVLEWNIIIWGVVVSIFGCVPMILAYPTYNIISKKLKDKHKDEIIQLSEELLNDKNND